MGSGASSDRGPSGGGGDGEDGSRPGTQGGGGGGGGDAGSKKSPMEKQIERYNYPPPAPPTQRKKEFFDPQKCKALDAYASKVPDDVLYGTFEEIGEYLTKNCTNEVQKVRSLFTWTTSIDIPTLQSTLERLPESDTPLDYLLKIHWQMGNHAHFFAQLCRASNLPCIVVTGMNKSAAYQLGGKVNKASMAAQWNAVYADEQWHLLDVFWASTCVVGKKSGEWALMDVDGEMVHDEEGDDGEGETKHQVNEAYFLPDPDALITTHYPDDPEWQLLPTPVSVEDFERRVYIRERFFDMDLNIDPQRTIPTCVAPAKTGEIELYFGMENNKAEKQFRYLLYRSRQAGDKNPDIPLERFVFFQKKKDGILYYAQFPLSGKYKMDIFGQIDKKHDTFDLCASYLIDCNAPKKNAQPLPDAPDIGWGPGVENEKVGLEESSHDEAIITTKDGCVEISFKMKNPLAMVQNLRSNELDEWLLRRNACLRVEGEKVVVTMRLQNKGEYALNLFAEKETFKGELPNVCNYLVRCTQDNPNLEAFPKLHEGLLGKGFHAEKLGVKATSHPGGVIDSDTGKLKLNFEHKDTVELFCELENNHIDAGHMSTYVKVSGHGKPTTMDVKFPKAGEYAINVYARMKGDDSRVYHVHSYLVNSSVGLEESENLPKSKGDVQVIPFATSGDTAVVRLPRQENELVGELQRLNAVDSPAKDQIKAKKTDKDDMFAVKLPEEGEYKMEVFEKKENGALENICSYYLVRHEPEPEPEPQEAQLTPEEQEKRQEAAAEASKSKSLFDQLKVAMSSQDPVLLRQAIADFEQVNPPDKKGQLKKAKKLLRFLQISNEIKDSMGSRNLQKLEKAVDAAVKEGFEQKLGLQMQMAQRVLEQLRRIEKLRHEILNLDQKTIAEIKSYSKPPDGILQVMQATFLLLGNTEKEIKEWSQVVPLIGKTGKESLKRRITEFNVEKLKIETAQKVKAKIASYKLEVIRDVSAGGGTFHVWVTGMVEECESRFQQSGGDLNMFRPKTSKKKH